MPQTVLHYAPALFVEAFSRIFSLPQAAVNLDFQPPRSEWEAQFLDLIELVMDWDDVSPQLPVSLLAAYSPDGTTRTKAPCYIRVSNPSSLPMPTESAPQKYEISPELVQSLTDNLKKLGTPGYNQELVVQFLAEKYLSDVGYALNLLTYREPLPIYDILRTMGGLLSADRTNKGQYFLGALDVSGIQDFVYNISSDRALRSLRGRSLFLELLSQVVLRDLLKVAGCSEDCLLVQNGGYYLFLLPCDKIEELRKNLERVINLWNRRLLLLQEGRIFLAFAMSASPVTVQEFLNKPGDGYSDAISSIGRELALRKRQKFVGMLEPGDLNSFPAILTCPICRRDVNKLVRLVEGEEFCDLCCFCIELGRQSVERGALEIDLQQQGKNYCWKAGSFTLRLGEEKGEWEEPGALRVKLNPREVEDLAGSNFYLNFPVAAGIEDDFNDLAKLSTGWKGLGALRADVDSLGNLIKGSAKYAPVISLASLSRLLNRFFSEYLMQLQQGTLTTNSDTVVNPKIRNFHFIYGGGDDLFVVGAWSDTLEVALDLGRCWRTYTAQNPDATISMGLSLHPSKFPVLAMAQISGEQLERAKSNKVDGRAKNSLSAAFARRPLFWEEVFDGEKPPLQELVQPLHHLLPSGGQDEENARLSRSFLRRMLQADAATHPLIENGGRWKPGLRFAHAPQGKVDYLYLLATSSELKSPETGSPSQHLRDYLRWLHFSSEPPDLSFFLNWLDLLVRQA